MSSSEPAVLDKRIPAEKKVKRVRFDLPPLHHTESPSSPPIQPTASAADDSLSLLQVQGLDEVGGCPHSYFPQGQFPFEQESAVRISPTPPGMMEDVSGGESRVFVDSSIESEGVYLSRCSAEERSYACGSHQEGTVPVIATATQETASTPVAPRKRRKQQEEDAILEETTRLRDIIGHGVVKLRIDEIILPMALPPEVADSVLTGIRAIPASILLYGPPGCGKTKLAKAIAGEARAAYLPVAPSDVLSKFVGESEASIRDIFKNAVDKALQLESKCAVVFFDEIDALGQSRANRGNEETDGCSRRVLAELLLQLNLISERKHRVPRYESDGNEMDDGSAVNEGSPYHSVHSARDREAVARIIVVAATNRIHDCDEALVRRFGVQLEVGLPSQRDRKKMLALHLEDVDNTISREEIDYLAKVTELWSGSEIENLSREAAMTPVRECIRSAALLRKRAARNEQSCGDVSGQEDSSDPADPDAEARKSLLLGFQTLRPVTVNDFMQAISLFTGKEHGSAYETLSNKKRNGGKHYDSSSDEED